MIQVFYIVKTCDMSASLICRESLGQNIFPPIQSVPPIHERRAGSEQPELDLHDRIDAPKDA